MFLQRKVWWCHHFVELLWNSQLLAMILSREKNGFGFGEFFFATFGGFLQTIHQESKEYFGVFFGCDVLIVQAGNHWGQGKQLRVVPQLLLWNSVWIENWVLLWKILLGENSHFCGKPVLNKIFHMAFFTTDCPGMKLPDPWKSKMQEISFYSWMWWAHPCSLNSLKITVFP